MKKIFLLLLTLIIFPLHIFAGEISVNKENITVEENANDTFKVTASNASGRLSVTVNNSNVTLTSSAGSEVFYADTNNDNTWVLMLDDNSVTINVTGVSEGASVIGIVSDGITDKQTNENIIFSKQIAVTVNHTPSTNANLSDIKIDNVSIVGFSPSITTYEINTDSENVAIAATVEEEHATVSPEYGVQALKYGLNKFVLKVIAESGATKDYLLKITRNDNRDTNNYLSSLTVSEGELVFDKNISSYVVKIENTVTDVLIEAEAESSKATVSGDGRVDIGLTNNVFEIIVTAENMTTRKYKITFVKNNEYIITYNSNGGTKCNPDAVAVTKGSKIGALCTTTKSGYRFIGWFTESSGGTKVTANTIPNKNYTIYAQWSKKVASNPDTGINSPYIVLIVIGLTGIGLFFVIKNRNISFD